MANDIGFYSFAILIIAAFLIHTNDARAALTREDAERALDAILPNAQETVAYVGIHDGKAFFRDASNKTLLSIMNLGENEVIRKYFSDTGYWSLFWLGGWDINQEGQYNWLDTNKPFVFNHWYYDVPTDSRYANCVYMVRSGYWMNKNCEESSGGVVSLCELQLL